MLKNTSPFKRKRTNLKESGKWLSLLTSTWWHGVDTHYSDTQGQSSSVQRPSPMTLVPLFLHNWRLEAELWTEQPHTYSQSFQMQLPPTAEKSSGIHPCWQLGILRIIEVPGRSRTPSITIGSVEPFLEMMTRATITKGQLTVQSKSPTQ